jgi:hypothetical protein
VLVGYVIHYADAVGGGSEEVHVANFSDRGFAAPDATMALPAGYRVQGVIGGAGAPAVSDVIRVGDTVGALTTRLTAATSALNSTG